MAHRRCAEGGDADQEGEGRGGRQEWEREGSAGRGGVKGRKARDGRRRRQDKKVRLSEKTEQQNGSRGPLVRGRSEFRLLFSMFQDSSILMAGAVKGQRGAM
jgi:hypothetical protein